MPQVHYKSLNAAPLELLVIGNGLQPISGNCIPDVSKLQ